MRAALVSAILLALALVAPGCGPASCRDECEDRCDAEPGSCEPSAAAYCERQCVKEAE